MSEGNLQRGWMVWVELTDMGIALWLSQSHRGRASELPAGLLEASKATEKTQAGDRQDGSVGKGVCSQAICRPLMVQGEN